MWPSVILRRLSQQVSPQAFETHCQARDLASSLSPSSFLPFPHSPFPFFFSSPGLPISLSCVQAVCARHAPFPLEEDLCIRPPRTAGVALSCHRRVPHRDLQRSLDGEESQVAPPPSSLSSLPSSSSSSSSSSSAHPEIINSSSSYSSHGASISQNSDMMGPTRPSQSRVDAGFCWSGSAAGLSTSYSFSATESLQCSAPQLVPTRGLFLNGRHLGIRARVARSSLDVERTLVCFPLHHDPRSCHHTSCLFLLANTAMELG